MLDNLPSVGQMFKLIILLVLVLIAVSIVVAIVKVLTPLLFIAAIVAGGYYLYNRMKETDKLKNDAKVKNS